MDAILYNCAKSSVLRMVRKNTKGSNTILVKAAGQIHEKQKGLEDYIIRPIWGFHSHYWITCSLGKI